MNVVLDACALIAFLRHEAGADAVESLLVDPANRCFIHSINLCEVYYDFLRAADAKVAESVVDDLLDHGIVNRQDMSLPFWKAVGRLKGTIRKISLADCFAIALAAKLGATIVPSDHREFDPLVANGVCRVRFIR